MGEGAVDRREGKWQRILFETLKRKENIYAIRWEMGERGMGGWERVRPLILAFTK